MRSMPLLGLGKNTGKENKTTRFLWLIIVNDLTYSFCSSSATWVGKHLCLQWKMPGFGYRLWNYCDFLRKILLRFLWFLQIISVNSKISCSLILNLLRFYQLQVVNLIRIMLSKPGKAFTSSNQHLISMFRSRKVYRFYRFLLSSTSLHHLESYQSPCLYHSSSLQITLSYSWNRFFFPNTLSTSYWNQFSVEAKSF